MVFLSFILAFGVPAPKAKIKELFSYQPWVRL